jgi:hypothetical protein
MKMRNCTKIITILFLLQFHFFQDYHGLLLNRFSSNRIMKLQRFKFFGIATIFFAVLSSCTKEKVPTSNTVICTDTIFFSSQIEPMIQNNCTSCHNIGGSLPTLTNHAEIASYASSILSTMNGSPQLMPLNGPPLNDTLIQQFSCWINQGKANN